MCCVVFLSSITAHMCLSDLKLFHTDSLGNYIANLGDIRLDQIRDDCDYVYYDDCSNIDCSNSDLKVIHLNI